MIPRELKSPTSRERETRATKPPPSQKPSLPETHKYGHNPTLKTPTFGHQTTLSTPSWANSTQLNLTPPPLTPPPPPPPKNVTQHQHTYQNRHITSPPSLLPLPNSHTLHKSSHTLQPIHNPSTTDLEPLIQEFPPSFLPSFLCCRLSV